MFQESDIVANAAPAAAAATAAAAAAAAVAAAVATAQVWARTPLFFVIIWGRK